MNRIERWVSAGRAAVRIASGVVAAGVSSLLGGVLLVALLLAPALSQGVSPLNEGEKELLRVNGHVLTVQRQLSAARKRGDDPEKVRKLQKKFDKLQKKRVGLLRETWQM